MVLAQVAPVEASEAETGWPFVSIIVPTYNRATVLPYLMNALGRQAYPSDRMELIVVDNSSSDNTEDVVLGWGSVLPFDVHFYRKENQGPAVSRNYGAARAAGEILAFTDSDCVPHPTWIRSSVSAIAEGAGLVCGPVLPQARAGGPGLLASQLSPSTRDDGLYPTANLVLRKKPFDAVGGFNQRFGLYPWGDIVAGEDADLAWRLRRFGERPSFVVDAAVDHLATRLTRLQLLLRPIRVQILPHLVRSIPELRATYLWKRYFVARSRTYFYLGLLGIAIAILRGSWFALVAAIPWLYFNTVTQGTTRSLAKNGQWFKAGAWLLLVAYFEVLTTTALAISSVRNRRLVL